MSSNGLSPFDGELFLAANGFTCWHADGPAAVYSLPEPMTMYLAITSRPWSSSSYKNVIVIKLEIT
jgi:hypothetical protein